MKHQGLLLGVLLAVMTLMAYLPAMRHGGFIWDDDDYVTDNRTLRSVAGLKRIWTEPGAVPQYYPLVHTSYWLEYRLWGLDPRGYHIVNVLLHIMGALLLWRVLEVLRVPYAWLGAALFALHPVNVESVAWITERKNVLSGVFYLGAARVYLGASGKGQTADAACPVLRYLLTLGLFVCALLSKTVTCTLPAALLLVLAWRGGGGEFRKHVLLMLPMFALGLAFAGVTVWMERNMVGATGREWDLTFIERCLIAGRAVWFYACKLVLPWNLTFIYPRWEIDTGVWWQYLFPVGLLGVVAGLWSARRKTGPGPLVAVLFFGGTLLPALGFVNVYPMRYSFVADHFQYLAGIGLLALLAAGAGKGAGIGGRGVMSSTGPAMAALVLAVLGVLTWRQCGIYGGLEELWTDTLRKNPDCWLAHNNLGVLYTERGEWGPAHGHLTRAVEIKPDYERSYCNLGSLYERQGRRSESLAAYRKALEIDPDSPQANYNLGAALDDVGDTAGAEKHYRRALVPGPHLAKTHNNLGNIVAAQGREAAAFKHYREAIRLDPEYSEPHSNLGILLGKHGDEAGAIQHCRKAVELAPDNAEALNNLALMLVRAKRYVEARTHYEKALRTARQPNPVILANLAELDALEERHAAAQKKLGLSLAVSGRLEEALRALEAARGLAPDDPEVHNNIGAVLVRLGEKEKAAAALKKALELRPDYEEARRNLDYLNDEM